MHAEVTCQACFNARQMTAWRAFARDIHRNFVVIRLKYPAV